jgi:hypothetical protein
MRRLLSALILAASLSLPAVASAAELYSPNDATAPTRPFARPLQDALVERPAGLARAAGANARIAQSQPQSFFASNGDGPIRVSLSSEYGPVSKAKVQATVDFLASRVHGSELRRLALLILTPSELREACSATALACYLPKLELMIIPGEQTPAGEVPVEYVITHEYGHHIAANRNNDPFNERSSDSAVAFGPKRWGTYEQVCAGVAERRYFPGDQGENYERNPGENWAEAYAQLHYQGLYRWGFDPSLAPDAGAFAAVQADVLRPWLRNVAVRRSGSLTARRRSKTFPVDTTLDGRVVLTLDSPRGANFDVQILDRGRIVARTRGRRPGGIDRLTAVDCVVRRFDVRVVRRSGSGTFSLRVQTAG